VIRGLIKPPAWTIHLIFCNNVTTNGVKINSHGVQNGDGWNPDSSSNCYIFNSVFETGDDCIAIKAGKGLKGYQIGRPSKNIRITDCLFISGHSLAIGSETGGGIVDVFIQDCTIGNITGGIRLKSHPTRGGYIKNITVKDCTSMTINIRMQVAYNNDGEPAPVLPLFSNMNFTNIDLRKGSGKIIDLQGLDKSYIKDVKFSNIYCPANAVIMCRNCERIDFKNVNTLDGIKPPEYRIKQSKKVNHDQGLARPPTP
jgi:exo-poly-alpha-galacturonosidase